MGPLQGPMMMEDAQPLTVTATKSNSLYNVMKRQNVRLMLELLLVVGFLASLSCAIGLGVYMRQTRGNSSRHDRYPAPECLHAIGGGPVAPGGGLDSAAPKQFTHCAQQLAAYADPQQGAYWREVELAVADAMQYFGFANSSQDILSSRLLAGAAVQTEEQGSISAHVGTMRRSVLSSASKGPPLTDETHGRLVISDSQGIHSGLPSWKALSAAAGEEQEDMAASAVIEIAVHQQIIPAPDGRQVVVFDIDETLLSNMEQMLNPDEWPWDKWVAAAQAPPLLPVQGLYNALCSAGFLVALVTGRREAGRTSTMLNLARARYGSPCDQQKLQSLAQTGQRSTACCYSALLMRAQNDTRLASVYKPWARQQLLKEDNKLEIVALVGDQFSDLNGETSAPYAFKLPNPFYYIL